MNHFTLTVADTPALLRKVADSIDQLGDIDVFDITFKEEDDEHKTMTVYFAPRDSPD